MIASPGDVATERQVARDIIHEWNYVNSEERGIVLMPVGWETHSFPVMGERAQEAINKQVLRDSDLLVAVFWTRLGSPTGSSESGTVEEIEEHISKGKPAMIYFSSAPVRPDSVENNQYVVLKAFKETCIGKGLIEKYDSISEFREKFSRQLAHIIINTFSRKGGEETQKQTSPVSKISIPNLSEEGKVMLIEGSKDMSGTILRVRTLGGLHIKTNGKSFADLGNPRSEAKWQAGIDQLLGGGYITDSGYLLADLLKKL
jgi:hypothetical protein